MPLTITYEPTNICVGTQVQFTAVGDLPNGTWKWEIKPKQVSSSTLGAISWKPSETSIPTVILDTSDISVGEFVVRLVPEENGDETEQATTSITINRQISSDEAVARIVSEGLKISAVKRAATPDQAFWVALRRCIYGRQFGKYQEFIKSVFCDNDGTPNAGLRMLLRRNSVGSAESTLESQNMDVSCLFRQGVHGYELLKAATEVFLLCNQRCGDLRISSTLNDLNDNSLSESRLGYLPDVEALNNSLRTYLGGSASPRTLPYIERMLPALGLLLEDAHPDSFPFCHNNFRSHPCLFELIWSYWHEEAMLVQTISAVALRFQNRRVSENGRNLLANFELDPLRPLNNLLWGYIQDEDRRLTVRRRAHEYEHEYGLKLVGKAVENVQPADRRSKFLESFHNLLRQCAMYYREEANQFVKADAFPLLTALRSVHILLSEGAHNQFGDLPSTARMEMLIQQYLLSLPPMREFLQSRASIAYPEAWMGQVDSMKRLMGWTDVSVIDFNTLAVAGEMILLSIRYATWLDVGTTADQVANWALYWRSEIQSYIESYRAVTGVDLSAQVQRLNAVDAQPPALHIQRRLAQQGAIQ